MQNNPRPGSRKMQENSNKRFRQSAEPHKFRQSAEPHKPRQSAEPHKPRQSAGPHKFRQSAGPYKPRQSAEPYKFRQSAEPHKFRQSAGPHKFRQSAEPYKPRIKRKVRPAAAAPAGPQASAKIRLNRFIANSGLCSRREADLYIAAGVITVNGEVVTAMGQRVNSTDDIRFNGERLKSEKKVYIVMNKPKNFVTTLSDPHAEKTVMDLITPAHCAQRVYPVGRLDRDTTGVLLLTNDGELTKTLTHPSFERKKIYEVHLDKNLKQTDFEALVTGIKLEDGPIQVDRISYLEGDLRKVGLEIHSGRNRIVRRMFGHLGYEVQKLDRVYFAGLTKKSLKRGQWRFLTEKEVNMLKMGAFE